MSDKELKMQEDDNLVNEEEVTLESASAEETEEVIAEAEEVQPEDDSEELAEEKPAMPKTKIGMINAMVEYMKGHKKDDIAASYGKLMSAFEPDDEEDDDEDDDEEEAKESKKKSVKEVKKVTKEDIDVSDDVKALFGEADLSEEFKESATTIFEAAVVSKINEVLDTVSVDMDA